MPSRRSTHFRDAVSRIDFVLVQKSLKSEAVRLQNFRFISNLKKVGLKIEREKGVKYIDLIFIKIHTPDHVLKTIADIHKVALTFEKDRTIPHYNNRWNIFNTPVTKRPNMQDPMFKRCSESVRGEPNKTFTTAERIMLTHFILLRTKFGSLPDEYGLTTLLEMKNFEDAYPLHDGKWEWENTGPLNDRQILSKFWGNWKWYYKQQPLHIVQKYFGPEIGFHYAWMGFYTKMLLPVAILGVVVFIASLALQVLSIELPRTEEVCSSDIDICPPCINGICLPRKLRTYCRDAFITYLVDNILNISFAILMAIWATLFLEFWQREEYTLLYKWNLINLTADIDELPDFKDRTKNYIRVNRYTGVKEHYYPLKLQLVQYGISAGFCFLCILLIIATVMGIRATIHLFKFYMYMSEIQLFLEFGSIILKIYSGLVTVLSIKWYTPYLERISRKLTDREVHRTHISYLNSYILKSYVMNFFNSYTVLFYNAFFRDIAYTHPGDHEKYDKIFGMGSDVCSPSIGCTIVVSVHVFFIMLKNYMVTIVTNCMIIPRLLKMFRIYVLRRVEKKKKTKEVVIVWEHGHMPQWELDYELAKPTEMYLLHSFMGLILEYGMVTFFVSALPLLPLLALFNNIIELRTSAEALVTRIRRNVPKRVRGLGAWNNVMIVVTRLSFLISGCIIAFTSKFVHRITYKLEYGSLEGFINETLSQFLVEDFHPSIKKQINSKFPNLTICHYPGLRNPYNHTVKYAASDRFYQILSLELVALVAFVHCVFFLTQFISLVISKVPSIIRECIAHEEQQLYANNLRKVNEEMRRSNARKYSTKKQ